MPISFVDLKKRPPAPGELKRFAQKHGARALLDEEGKAYKKANLGYLTMGDAEVLERVVRRSPTAAPAARALRQRGHHRRRRGDLEGAGSSATERDRRQLARRACDR